MNKHSPINNLELVLSASSAILIVFINTIK